MTTVEKLGISRRQFLNTTCCASAWCLAAVAGLPGLAMASGPNYYAENRERFLKQFDQKNRGAQTLLATAAGPKLAAEVRRQAGETFVELLPGLPYLGGDRNPLTRWIVLAGHYLAFYRPMKAGGMSTEQCGRLMYDIWVQNLSEKSRQDWLNEGARRLSPEYMARMRRWATWSQSRKSLPGWVVSYVDGAGKDFDYGVDYHQCGAVLYFKKLGAADLAPYFCLVDWPSNKLMATGLVRTKTLAMGDSLCDFRFKKGRPVSQDWSTEQPRIKQKFKS
jgi:L-2-amino-thiazoline-4-carboxylic acid hydrolase